MAKFTDAVKEFDSMTQLVSEKRAVILLTLKLIPNFWAASSYLTTLSFVGKLMASMKISVMFKK